MTKYYRLSDDDTDYIQEQIDGHKKIMDEKQGCSYCVYVNGCHMKRDYFNDSETEEQAVKPYLRPMSSMTEDEQRTLDSMCNGVEMVSRLSGLKMFDKAFNWLNRNMFDYQSLIEKGLALDVFEGMYKTE